MNDQTFDALADEHRREVLIALLDERPQAAAVQMADGGQLALETDRAKSAELYHVHLPKLEDCGIIDWDRDENRVRKGPAFDEVRPLLEAVVEHADRV